MGSSRYDSAAQHDRSRPRPRVRVERERLVLPLAGHGVNEYLRIRVLAPRHRLSSERTLHTAVLPLQSLSLDRPTDLTLHASELRTPIDPIAQESGHAGLPGSSKTQCGSHQHDRRVPVTRAHGKPRAQRTAREEPEASSRAGQSTRTGRDTEPEGAASGSDAALKRVASRAKLRHCHRRPHADARPVR